MLTTFGQIKIGKYVFSIWKQIEIRNDNDQISATAEIILPNLFTFTEKNVFIEGEPTTQSVQLGQVEALIKINDTVEIYLGYSPDKRSLRFLGYVTNVFPHDMVHIMCEDGMWLLKNNNVPSKYWPSATLQDVVFHATEGVMIDINFEPEGLGSTKIGAFAIKNENIINGVQVLEQLRQFGFTCRIVNTLSDPLNVYSQSVPVLTVYAPVSNTHFENKIPLFIFEHNIKSNNLQYNKDEAKKFVVKGISTNETEQDDGKLKKEKISVYIYKQGGEFIVRDLPIKGEQRTLNRYNLTMQELIEACETEYDKFAYNGMVGSFKAFIDPPLYPNQKIRIASVKYPEKNGYYKTKSIITSAGEDNGQTVEVGLKLNE